MTIVRWEPLRELSTLQSDMNRLLQRDVRRAGAGAAAGRRAAPPLDPGDGPRRDRGRLRPARRPPRRLAGGRPASSSRTPCSPSPASARSDHETKGEGFYRVERSFGAVQPLADAAQGRRRRGDRRVVHRRRARGPDPEARAAQAAPDRHQRRRPARARGRGRRVGPAASQTPRSPPVPASPPDPAGSPALGSPRSHGAPLVRHPHPRPRLARPHRHAAPPARRRPHPRLRPARHEGRRQDARGLRGRRPRLRHGAEQHLPPLPRARPRAGGALRRRPRLHALGQARDHGLRRVPGLLDGPRHRRGRDQGPQRRLAAARQRRDPRHRRAGRALPLLRRRRGEVHGPGDLDGRPGRAQLRHRAGLRRVPAVPRHARVHAAQHGAHPSLARPLPRLARAARPARPRASTRSSRAAWRRTCAAGAPRR